MSKAKATAKKKSPPQIVEAPVDEVKVLTSQQQRDLEAAKSISDKIRYLDSQQIARGQIVKVLAKHLGRNVRYQHVRNVLETPLKRKA